VRALTNTTYGHGDVGGLRTVNKKEATLRPCTPAQLKEYYEKEAELTDTVKRMYSDYYGKERFDKIMEIMKRLHYRFFCDVGCGSGAYLINDGVGVDLTIGYLHQAQTYAHTKHLTVNVIQADASKLPFRSNSVDFILCSQVLEHVINWQVVLNELITSRYHF